MVIKNFLETKVPLFLREGFWLSSLKRLNKQKNQIKLFENRSSFLDSSSAKWRTQNDRRE